MGFARLAETPIRALSGKSESEKLSAVERIACSSIGEWAQSNLTFQSLIFLLIESPALFSSPGTLFQLPSTLIGGALGTWNQPIEVIRVEMQSMAKAAPGAAARPTKPTIMNTLAYVYKEAGIKGLYRGVSPRICLGIWQTVSLSLLHCVDESFLTNLITLISLFQICMVSLADYVKEAINTVAEKAEDVVHTN